MGAFLTETGLSPGRWYVKSYAVSALVLPRQQANMQCWALSRR